MELLEFVGWRIGGVMKNRSMPGCGVVPEIAYPSVVDAGDWLCRVFGFTVRISMGGHRAQLNVESGAVVLIAMPKGDGASGDVGSRSDMGPSVLVRVDDVDGHYKRASGEGARIVRTPADYPYGERQYTAEDLWGRRWTFSETIADVTPEEWGGVSGRLL
jgi:uncharacterized glyoxalase superfamily protein PhnB